jgi:hypothetical protein
VQKEADALVRQLGWPERAPAALATLTSFVNSLLEVARDDADSPDRRIARRVLAGLRASRRSVPHRKYQEWMAEISIPAPPSSH